MKTRCPGCGAEMSVDVLLANEDAGATMRALLDATPLGRAIYRYLGLFRPAARGLTWDRARALVEEILPAIAAGRVERAGRVYAAPEPAWIAAIEQMLAQRDTLRLPLKSHGYLLEIIAAGAERAESRAETGRERERRALSNSRGATDTPSPQRGEGGGEVERTPMPNHIRDALAQYQRAPATRIDTEEAPDARQDQG